ncbi:MAG: hypothetical protein ACRDWD_02170 [Acidimicrobiia bacterium]
MVAAAGVGALFVLPSDASLIPKGNCTVTASVTPGKERIDPARGDGPFTIPVDGRVEWQAALTAPMPIEPRAFHGQLSVVAPGGFDETFEGLLEFRSWSSRRSSSVSSDDAERYNLPSWTPRGVDIPVRGFQRDPLGGCRGEILVRIKGGRFDSPLAWVAVGGTLFWLAATLLAGKLRDEPHTLFCVGVVMPAFVLGWLVAMARSSSGGTPVVVGLVCAVVAIIVTLALNRQSWASDFWGGHPALGWVAGLLLGLFVSLDLFVFGIVRLDSDALLYPPLFGIIGGLTMAWWTPFHGREYA